MVAQKGLVDNEACAWALGEGARTMGVALSSEQQAALLRLGEELLRWNAKVNLTAVTEPLEVVEKHLLDSVAVAVDLAEGESLLDLGSGPGFPGLPLRIARPDLCSVTLVEAVGKKVSFAKHAAATLGLSSVRALHARAEGFPEREGIPRAKMVISRALMDVGGWLALGLEYVEPAGRVAAMLGRWPEDSELARAAEGLRAEVLSVRRYRLPRSGSERAVAVFQRGEPASS